MKKIFLFILSLATLIYANTENSSINNEGNIHHNIKKYINIVGIYEPTKRECGQFKGFYCEEGITQFEFKIEKQLSPNKKNQLKFIVWIAKNIKNNKPIDKLNLVTNGTYIVPLLKNVIKPNETIILEESKKENYLTKVLFIDSNRGVFTFGYKDNPIIINFKRITKEEDKYLRHYRKKK